MPCATLARCPKAPRTHINLQYNPANGVVEHLYNLDRSIGANNLAILKCSNARSPSPEPYPPPPSPQQKQKQETTQRDIMHARAHERPPAHTCTHPHPYTHTARTIHKNKKASLSPPGPRATVTSSQTRCPAACCMPRPVSRQSPALKRTFLGNREGGVCVVL